MHHLYRAPRWRRTAALLLAAALAVSLAACKPAATTETKPPAATSEVVVASTTSTQDSGLFDVLQPEFEKAYPQYKLKIVAVGTGEALKLGETKDADVLLVHAKSDEEKFVANGFGKERRDVCYNDFIIVGPEADPSGVKAAADTTAAMQALATGKAEFISRGDDSGTHKKELKLWKAAGIATPTPEAQSWYESTGQGMGETLKVASEKTGYTLTDRATFLAMEDKGGLAIVREGDKGLLNQYGVIVVTGAKNEAGGQAFFDYVLSAAGQQIIGAFGVEKYGQALFTPNAK
ncbi:MAG: extracellular solute-binding protein [Actinobacteria bacterium]|nr:MAG: extracellular solute-binding protein [Actinomycetota bacterium]